MLALVVCCGIAVRVAFPSRLAIEHFDEGVYASNLWFPAELGGQYPLRQLYAPPLLPALIEAALITNLSLAPSGRVANWAPFVPGILAGCATVPLLWWMGRTWFGPSTGIAAATLTAFSDIHILYSRTALTEPVLILLLAAALWFIERAVRTRTAANITLAAVLSGLAWWTKYNGWLTLAIPLAALLVWVVSQWRTAARSELLRRAVTWSVVALGAFLIWSPFLYSLQGEGGYANVAANHRQYVVGIGGWLSSFTRQSANLSHYDGWLTGLGVGLAVYLTGFVAEQPNADGSRDRRWLRAGIACCIAGLAATSGSFCVLGLLGLAGNVDVIRRPLRKDDRLATFVLAVWFVGLFLASPLYHPYPRLMLPWLCATWLSAGVGIERLLVGLGQRVPQRARRPVAIGCFVAALCLLGLSGPRFLDIGVPAWQTRTGLAKIAGQFISRIAQRQNSSHRPLQSAVVYVVGEPALVYQLRSQGVALVVPLDSVSTATRRPPDPGWLTFLVVGPHAQRSSTFAAELAEAGARMTLLESQRYRASDLVLLDHHAPDRLRARATWPEEEVQLYLIPSNQPLETSE